MQFERMASEQFILQSFVVPEFIKEIYKQQQSILRRNSLFGTTLPKEDLSEIKYWLFRETQNSQLDEKARLQYLKEFKHLSTNKTNPYTAAV